MSEREKGLAEKLAGQQFDNLVEKMSGQATDVGERLVAWLTENKVNSVVGMYVLGTIYARQAKHCNLDHGSVVKGFKLLVDSIYNEDGEDDDSTSKS